MMGEQDRQAACDLAADMAWGEAARFLRDQLGCASLRDYALDCPLFVGGRASIRF